MAVGGRRALALALRNQLRKATASGGLGLDDAECQVMLDGRPEPRWGNSSYLAFYAVHQGRRHHVGENTRLEQAFEMLVTVSTLADRPFDRTGTDIIEAAVTGLEVRVDDLIACVTKAQWTIMNDANAILGSGVNGFIEAIYYGDDEEPRECHEDWFWAARPSGRFNKWSRHPETDKMFVGLKVTVRFIGSLRIQSIEEASG